MNVKHPNQVKNALCVWFANNAFFNKAMCTLGSLPPSILRTPPLSPDARAFDIFIELVDLQTMRIADLVSQARVVGLPWVCVFGHWSGGQVIRWSGISAPLSRQRPTLWNLGVVSWERKLRAMGEKSDSLMMLKLSSSSRSSSSVCLTSSLSTPPPSRRTTMDNIDNRH